MAFPNTIATWAHFPEEFQIGYQLAAGTTAADIGKAVALDTSAPNTVKLTSVADERIFGRLETFEDRTSAGQGLVGTVARKFKAKLPATGAEGIGDSVSGTATPGQVTTATIADPSNIVVEVGADYVVVEKL